MIKKTNQKMNFIYLLKKKSIEFLTSTQMKTHTKKKKKKKKTQFKQSTNKPYLRI